uniref:Galanin peptides n=2 Tax=Pygocentrus nattereri TaxID=42514 RepID=A0A3B4C832_PYGNA
MEGLWEFVSYFYCFSSLQMQKCVGGVCVSLILCAVLSETLGMVIAAKEKRGWTLNSAGYLLGPHAIDSHRTLSDKHGLAGKRDMEDDFKSGTLRITDEDVVHTIIDFLSYLKLKEMGALDNLPSSLTSEELSQP